MRHNQQSFGLLEEVQTLLPSPASSSSTTVVRGEQGVAGWGRAGNAGAQVSQPLTSRLLAGSVTFKLSPSSPARPASCGRIHTLAFNTYRLLNQCGRADRPPSIPSVGSGSRPMSKSASERAWAGLLLPGSFSDPLGPAGGPFPELPSLVHTRSPQHAHVLGGIAHGGGAVSPQTEGAPGANLACFAPSPSLWHIPGTY